MLRIRLRRTGKKKQPSYRVVVADQRAPRDGAFVEIIGHYNPRTTPRTLVLKEERVRYWLGKGAQPSETVHRLLHGEGLIDIAPPQRPSKPSKAELETAAAAEAARAEAEAEAEAPAETPSDAAGSADDGDGSSDGELETASDDGEQATESEAESETEPESESEAESEAEPAAQPDAEREAE